MCAKISQNVFNVLTTGFYAKLHTVDMAIAHHSKDN